MITSESNIIAQLLSENFKQLPYDDKLKMIIEALDSAGALQFINRESIDEVLTELLRVFKIASTYNLRLIDRRTARDFEQHYFATTYFNETAEDYCRLFGERFRSSIERLFEKPLPNYEDYK